jgi:hypothetical protein
MSSRERQKAWLFEMTCRASLHCLFVGQEGTERLGGLLER